VNDRRPVVAGIGSHYRHDDAVGLVVATQVATTTGVVDLGPLGEPLDLLGLWDHAPFAVVVDAARSGAAPGTVHIHDVTADAVDTSAGLPTSTHGLGLVDVALLARILETAPGRIVAVAVEGADFSRGEGLSVAVAAAVPAAVRLVEGLLRSAAGA